MSFITLGEGWHNYHHTFPWDYKCAEKCDIFNISGRVISLFGTFGWTYNLKSVSPGMVSFFYTWHADVLPLDLMLKENRNPNTKGPCAVFKQSLSESSPPYPPTTCHLHLMLKEKLNRSPKLPCAVLGQSLPCLHPALGNPCYPCGTVCDCCETQLSETTRTLRTCRKPANSSITGLANSTPRA